MMLTPARVLEENLDRVVDSVLRTLAAGGVAPEVAACGEREATAAEAQVRETIADLCGHVAFALKSLEPRAYGVASYQAPVASPVPAGAPRSLDIRR